MLLSQSVFDTIIRQDEAKEVRRTSCKLEYSLFIAQILKQKKLCRTEEINALIDMIAFPQVSH